MVFFLGGASSVSRIENARTSMLGRVYKALQPIFVDRNDTKNKTNVVDEIRKRANVNSEWPQTLMYPEGTTDNRTSLISFKPGFFKFLFKLKA